MTASIDALQIVSTRVVDPSLLCCPGKYHGNLVWVSADKIICESCRQNFVVVEGSPILLDETQSMFTSMEVSKFTDTRQFPENKGWRMRLRSLFPASTSRENSLEIIEKFRHLLPETPTILVIGCGFSGRQYVEAFPNAKIYLTDVTLQGDATLVCDAEALPFWDESLDCVIIDQVLEHTSNPTKIVEEIRRCLKPDGLVYSGIPFHTPVHGYPFDFQRYTPLGHRLLFRGFQELEMRITQGPVSALSLTLIGFLTSLFNNLWWRRFSSFGVRLLFRPLFWLDHRYHKVGTLTIPGASAFLGKKQLKEFHPKEIVRDWLAAAAKGVN
jgi:SAM-dependent methyltransferase